MASFTIGIVNKPRTAPRKICKIVPYANGGFAVLAPYHSAKRGILAKHQIDYRDRISRVPRSEMVEYTASDRAKLSFHPDGFVQFSGENPNKIISGRDPVTGEPKGLGILLENPLYHPIKSGPTFGLTVWGLHDFAPMSRRKGTGQNVDVVFDEEDYYYRGCTPSTWNAYAIEVFVLEQHAWSAVRKRKGRLVLSAAFGMFEASGAVLDLLVADLRNQPILLGILCSRLEAGFPASSGFTLNSPSDRRAGSPTANVLMAVYPDFFENPPKNTLDRP